MQAHQKIKVEMLRNVVGRLLHWLGRLKYPPSLFPYFRDLRYFSTSEDASTDASKVTSSTTRLDTVKNLLQTPKRLKYTTIECHRIYKEAQTTVVEDLLNVSDHAVHMPIVSYYKKSKLMAAFILDQMCTATIEGKYESVLSFLKVMEAVNILSKVAANIANTIDPKVTTNQEIVTKLSSILILENLRVGEPLLAALCALKFRDHGATIEVTSISDIIASLSIKTPLRRTYHAYTIIKLLDTFSELEVPLDVRIDAVSSMLEGPVVPYFANIYYDKLEEENTESEKAKFNQLTCDLLEANIIRGHIHKCIDVWKLACLKDRDFARNNVALFGRLADIIVQKDRVMASQFVEDALPEELYLDPRVIDSILAIFGQTTGKFTKFEKLTRQLKPPLLRRSLSLLFVSFLAQRNEAAAERILKAIFGTKNGLTWEEFQSIVQKLLYQHKINQAMEMCSNADVNLSKGGYAKAAEFLLSHSGRNVRPKADVNKEEFDKKKWEFLLLTARKFKILAKEDPVLRKFTTSIVKFLSHHVSNKVSRKFYITFSYPDGVNKPYFGFLALLIPQEFNNLVYIDESNQLDCLKIIFDQAIVDVDKGTLLWSMAEMEAVGLLRLDIVKYYVTEKAQAVLDEPDDE